MSGSIIPFCGPGSRVHPPSGFLSLRSSVASFFSRRRGTNSSDDFCLHNGTEEATRRGAARRGKGKSAERAGPAPDWLINIKMPVLVKGTVYIHYRHYIDREGGVIVSDCYSYSAGSHAAEHECALLCWVNITSARGVHAWGWWTGGLLPSQ